VAARPIDPAILSDGDDDFRARHVGASEVAALFQCSPYLTEFELWHRRAGNISTPDFLADGMANNERIEWGIRLEQAILAGAADRYGYSVEEPPAHLSNGKGLGGHPDAFALDDRGPGILEIKTVDWIVRKGWGSEPPAHYLLQAQVYAGLAGRAWCDIVVLVGGNELRRYQYEFRPALFAKIEAAVVAFWQSIAANDPPRPDFARDGATLAEVLGEPTDEVIDLRRDNEADHLACEFLAAKADVKAAETRAEEAKTALLLKIGDAGRALLPSHRITTGMTKTTPDRPAEPGEIIKGRKGYRQFLLKEAN
jgi:predicted phage-related endonuclease